MNDRKRPAGGAGPVRPGGTRPGAGRGGRPVPPRPPAHVFWVRRLVVLGLPLVAVVLLVVWLTGRGGGDPSAAQDPQTQASPSPDASPSSAPADADGPTDCTAEQLVVAITPAGEAFAADVEPSFEVSLGNSGSTECLVDAGDAVREVVVTSGDDRVWSSLDCVPADAPTRTLLLAPGGEDVTTLAWPRIRSAAGCPADLPSPGEGTYSATVAVGGVTSAPAVFGLG